jgi:hypothetical protein
MSKALFQYRLRESSRARHIRLRVSVQRGLEVTVPRGYDHGKLPGLLERKKHWIQTALDRADANRKFFEPAPVWRLPQQITLPAIGRTWHLTARKTKASWVAVRSTSPDCLEISGRIDDEKACRAALTRWLARQAHAHLVPRLQSLSLKTGLRHERAYVKRQKTRWASCSRHKAISINAKLLFLSPELVDYTLVHELCHIKEMNHSKQFWTLLAAHRPHYRKLDADLRHMWKHIPRWAN